MKKLFSLASDIQSLCVENNWDFCFIGGIALQRWGEPRLTLDVDISILTGFGNEEKFIEVLMNRYKERMSGARDFALQNRVLLLQSEDNIALDIIFAALPFEEQVIVRASEYEFLEGIVLKTCSAEDLVVYKAFADRLRDWADVESIVQRQDDNLDWNYIKENLSPLAEMKEDADIMNKLENIKNKNI